MKLKAKKIALLLLVSAIASAIDVTMQFPDTGLQKDFLSGTTTQYNGTLSASSIFPGNYYFKVTSKKPSGPPPPPPPPSNPITDGTAFDRCFVHGWKFGADNSYTEVTRAVNGLQYDIFKSSSCGGAVGNSASTPAQAYLDGCSQGYNVVISTVSQMDGIPRPPLVPPFPPLP